MLDVEIVAVHVRPARARDDARPAGPGSTDQRLSRATTAGPAPVSPLPSGTQSIRSKDRDDYELLEGEVRKSRVSREDAPLNHDSQDFNFHVRPDPGSARLLFAGVDETTVEVEWETGISESLSPDTGGPRVRVRRLDLRLRSQRQDRNHPAHRHRRPPAAPHLRSVEHELRRIRRSGCRFRRLRSGRHQRHLFQVRMADRLHGLLRGHRAQERRTRAGPESAGAARRGLYAGPSLDGVFEFNIYLPRNPRVTMAQAGFAVPPVPLYISVSTPPNALTEGPGSSERVDVDRVDTEDGITYLRVRVDLQGYRGAATNAGLSPAGSSRRRTTGDSPDGVCCLNRLNITNDGDGFGTWGRRLASLGQHEQRVERVAFIRTAPGMGAHSQPGRPRRRGFRRIAVDNRTRCARSLGPELLRYPPSGPLPGPRDYGILFHTTGYEADGVVDDDAGTISVKVAAQARAYEWRNTCTISGATGSRCDRRLVVFRLRPLFGRVRGRGGLAAGGRHPQRQRAAARVQIRACHAHVVRAPTTWECVRESLVAPRMRRSCTRSIWRWSRDRDR